ncbi:hypothetical protein ACMDCR_03780 [Labrys okinawensis]|uniref:hypothetical protein n=1 Tax=Labrys okinawensis TaxID=346911 RepID=UPI0039BC42C8
MTEAYAFFGAFAVQILAVSVLHAAWFTRYVRAKAEAHIPGWDGKSRERFLGLYRAANTGVAVLGVVLLGWLFYHTQSPDDWSVGPALRLLAEYTIVQILPSVLVSLIAASIKRRALLRSPPQTKRTASLQRRGFFDIVSPFTVFLAAVGYVPFGAFMIYVAQHPVAGSIGHSLLLNVMLVSTLIAFVVYWLLYRRRKWPLETRPYRMLAVEVQVKIALYVNTVAIVYLSLIATLNLLHLARWVPFAMSAYVVIIMLCTSMMLFALRRQAEADGPASIPAS